MKTKIFSALVGTVILALGWAAAADAQTGNPNKSAAVTAWWVIFNDPQACTDNADTQPTMDADGNVLGECGKDDILAAMDAQAVDSGICIQHAAGVPANQWLVTVSASLLATNPVPDPAGGGVACSVFGFDGLTNPLGAEIHFIVSVHGQLPNSPKKYHQSDFEDFLATLDEGCDQVACADVQFAVHQADEGSDHTEAGLFWFFDPDNLEAVGMKQSDAESFAGFAVPDSFSTLWRSESGVTMVLQTSLKAADTRRAVKKAEREAAKAARAAARAARLAAKNGS